MLNNQNRPRAGRSLIAVLLVYAFALQTMLAGAIGVQHAVAASAGIDPAQICFGSGAPPGGDDRPAPARMRLQDCVVCSVACVPAILPTAPAVAPPLAAPAPAVLRPPPAPVAAARLKTPRLSQGPPPAA
ncbi:hypothetical protein STVA_01180 [Allostella vacuolata]|nr:hypothetical protein STVA_01180 [Stella vacuolata]